MSDSSAICGLLGPIVNDDLPIHWTVCSLPSISPFQRIIADVQDWLFLHTPSVSKRL